MWSRQRAVASCGRREALRNLGRPERGARGSRLAERDRPDQPGTGRLPWLDGEAAAALLCAAAQIVQSAAAGDLPHPAAIVGDLDREHVTGRGYLRLGVVCAGVTADVG